jgi:hypothetical protein
MSVDVAAYRDAEATFWSSFGRRPSAEHHVRLPTTGTTVRVQEVGEGPPVLFLHGGPNTGSTWVPLVAHLDGLRCLLVDRPGTGLSAPYPITASNLPRIGATVRPRPARRARHRPGARRRLLVRRAPGAAVRRRPPRPVPADGADGGAGADPRRHHPAVHAADGEGRASDG